MISLKYLCIYTNSLTPRVEKIVHYGREYKTLLEKAFEECKKHVAKLMNLGFEESSVLEITYKATFQLIIFALQKNLSNDIVKILFAGAETQDIVDLVIHATSSSGQKDLGNPRKKIRLDEE